MPVKLSKAQAQKGEERKIRVDFGKDGDLNLTIQTALVKLGSMRKINQAAKDNDIAAVADIFFSWVTEWDLLDDDDEVMPLDATTIDQLGSAFFVELATQIQEASVPNA